MLASLPEEARNLGKLEGVYPFSSVVTAVCWVAGILGLLVVPVVPILFVLRPPRAGSAVGLPVVLGVSGFFGLLGAFVIGAALYYRGFKYLVFEKGLVHIHRGRFTVVRWQDITAFWDLTFTMRLDTTAGEQIKLSVRYLADPSALKNVVEDRVIAPLLPGFLQRFKAGESIKFGPLAVGSSGLEYQGARLAWGEVKTFQIIVMMKAQTKHIRITQAGKMLPWCNVDGRRIPNLKVFLVLVHQARPDLV
jgi:hypothetical protein